MIVPETGIIDTLIGLPPGEKKTEHSASYMFKTIPDSTRRETAGDELIAKMDEFGITVGIVPIEQSDVEALEIVRRYPERLKGSLAVDPNQGMACVRELERAHAGGGVVAAQFMPAILKPPVPINSKRAYPVYAKCIELDIPIFVNGGVPGPRVPMESQYPGLVDEVAYDLPELRFVFRHGCEPWVDLTVKLLLKWPNLYYSTTGFAPKYYPREIIEFANRRGSEKIIYGGYYPWGLELERIFTELPQLPLDEAVWPHFLYGNAARVLKL